jgi:F-type H+-transporting ATPase subunit b
VLTAVVTSSGSSIEVSLVGSLVREGDEESNTAEGTDGAHAGESTPVAETQLNPIAPELKEVAWGFGAFAVLALVLRYWLFPKVRDGMTARYDSIQSDFDKADTLTASARAEVAEYDAQVASVRADAHSRVEAARATLEAERAAKIAEVNARIAEKRAAAAAEVEAARAAASSQVASAVADVAGLAGQLATGRAPASDVVAAAVDHAMGANA